MDSQYTWFDIVDDNLTVTCACCSNKVKPPKAVYVERRDHIGDQIICKDCIDPRWLETVKHGESPKRRGAGEMWKTTYPKLRLVKSKKKKIKKPKEDKGEGGAA